MPCPTHESFSRESQILHDEIRLKSEDGILEKMHAHCTPLERRWHSGYI
jgi:hypothetical protein